MNFFAVLWHSFESWAFGWGGLAGFVGVLCLVLWFFTPQFMSNDTAKAFLLNAGLACIAFAIISGYFIRIGYKSCADLFSATDQAAITRSKEGVRDIETCRDGGGSWDVVTGTCTKPQQ